MKPLVIIFSLIMFTTTISKAQKTADNLSGTSLNIDYMLSSINLNSDTGINLHLSQLNNSGYYHSDLGRVNYLNTLPLSNATKPGFSRDFLGSQSTQNMVFLNTKWTSKFVFDASGNLIDSELSIQLGN